MAVVSSGAALEQHACKVAVVEFEVSLVVELEERGAVGVVLLEVEVVELWLRCGVSTVLTNIHLNMGMMGKQQTLDTFLTLERRCL